MKKILFIAAFALLSMNMTAQEKSEYEVKTVELIKKTSGQQFQVMMDPLVKMVPQENQEAFRKELMESTSELYTQIAEIYMESFTEAEIDQILAFYETPVGKKMVATLPEITQKGMELGQAWGMKLQPIMAKYMN